MKCKICQASSVKFSEAKILNKYTVTYFQCSHCGFIQTEEAYWLNEAYSQAIASSDVGLVSRNIRATTTTTNIISDLFNSRDKFLDYGGGYGIFVRLMRDLGYNFYWHDKFCENLFAQGFEYFNNENQNYELATAFEVFEHFAEPIADIEQILNFSSNILFTTEILPNSNPKPGQWWYYALEEGQHISIYTQQALSIIASKLDLKLFSNGSSVHLLTSKKISQILFTNSIHKQGQRNNGVSLLQQDYLKLTRKTKPDSEATTEAEEYSLEGNRETTRKARIVFDSVFFQLYRTGIARVWKSLLTEWSNNGFAEHILVLDRAGTAPDIPGINYRAVSPYSYGDTEADKEMLQQICDEEGADLFISSYYTTPLTTPSVFMAYDMIPEVLGANFNEPMWREKHRAIEQALAYITISQNTANDLVKCFPQITPESVTVAHCGVDESFQPATREEIQSFKLKYGISKPYFLAVGIGSSYKNAQLFFQAFDQLPTKLGFEVVCTGSGGFLSERFRTYTFGSTVHLLQLSDEELRVAYSGAVVLVYPSRYEGFGLPVAEAMACGCPVITCPNASLPEVAGEAAIYVDDQDTAGMVEALCEVQKPGVRNSLVAAGREWVKQFSWAAMAENVSAALIEATLSPLNLNKFNFITFPDWRQDEEELGEELYEVLKAIATHPRKEEITLLVYRGEMEQDDINLFLSGVAMNLLLAEEIDISEGAEISPVGELSYQQWQVLLPRLRGRIVLQNESHLENYQEKIPVCQLDNLHEIQP